MAKLDEIAELLTEELHNFEQSVQHLEQVREFLDQYILTPDTSEVDELIKAYHQRQQKELQEQKKLLRNLYSKVQGSTLLPKWMIILCWIWCFLNLIVWGLSVHHFSQATDKEEAAFEKGKEQYVGHFREFFDGHPEARDAYRDWIKQSEPK